MKIEVKIDSAYAEPKVIVVTASMSEEIDQIIKKISSHNPQVISGNKNGKIEILEPSKMIRVYTDDGKVYADTEKGTYALRLRLYEMMTRLEQHSFVRISNAEIINLSKVVNFDLSFTGTICVKLANDSITYVSRRYVSKIKKVLGI